MKNIRTISAALVIILLACGYAASQFAFFANETAAHAVRMDQPSIAWLALLILTAAIVLAFLPQKDGDEPS